MYLISYYNVSYLIIRLCNIPSPPPPHWQLIESQFTMSLLPIYCVGDPAKLLHTSPPVR